MLFIAGRRNNLSLEYILKFVTGMDEVPVVGYGIQYTAIRKYTENIRNTAIVFQEVQASFLPTANTCPNQLNLPLPSYEKRLPSNITEVFDLYDYAFCNCYFGIA